MTSQITEILLDQLDSHPNNPRLVQREDVVEAILAGINGHGFDPAHALIVRPLKGRFQVISGHHRAEAAKRAGLPSVAAWVREMDDDTAYMELVRSNAQSELTALERGLHALRSGFSVRDYADRIGRSKSSVQFERQAAEVADAVSTRVDSAHARHLAEIHAAPSWLWPALVEKLVDAGRSEGGKGLSVEKVRQLVSGLKDASEPPEWANASAIAQAIVTGIMRLSEIKSMASAVERALAALDRGAINAEEYVKELGAALTERRPGRLADVMAICNAVQDKQEKKIAEARRKEAEDQKAKQDREAQIAAMRSNVSLVVWETLDAETKAMLLDVEGEKTASVFNKQDTDAIEWAQWSWNPVTGCQHTCPYCYARDIANQHKMAEVYPNGFAPSLRPLSLLAPSNMKVPREAEHDTRYKNVFTCSMADLFGRWVPEEWINAVLNSVRSNPQWNFLFLTKFPKRMAEFDIPANAWMGTTVDLQARVKNAEAAFSKVTAGVRWLSVEPMLEPIKFSRLDLFQWIVIGGSTASSETPEWRPPYEWHADLTAQAIRAGVKVYHKTNLLGARRLELPFDAPIKADPSQAPVKFHYLGKGKSQAEAA